jgi:hypothetical protein
MKVASITPPAATSHALPSYINTYFLSATFVTPSLLFIAHDAMALMPPAHRAWVGVDPLPAIVGAPTRNHHIAAIEYANRVSAVVADVPGRLQLQSDSSLYLTELEIRESGALPFEPDTG